jgi:hypothetical protein
MTRKDYEVLAQALKNAAPMGCQSEDAHDTWARTVAAVAKALQQDNPRFDVAKFCAAIL